MAKVRPGKSLDTAVEQARSESFSFSFDFFEFYAIRSWGALP